MRAITHTVLHGIFVAAALVGLAVPNHAQALTPDDAKAIAMDAYIYGYSLITTEVTRIQMTDVDKVEFFLLTQSGTATDGPNSGSAGNARLPRANFE